MKEAGKTVQEVTLELWEKRILDFLEKPMTIFLTIAMFLVSKRIITQFPSGTTYFESFFLKLFT